MNVTINTHALQLTLKKKTVQINRSKKKIEMTNSFLSITYIEAAMAKFERRVKARMKILPKKIP